jgi:predicted aspartyl protease
MTMKVKALPAYDELKMTPSQWNKQTMARFEVEIELVNSRDEVLANEGIIAPEKVRRCKVKGVVDSGAAELVLPESVAKQLGVPVKRKVKVRYADHRNAVRDKVELVRLTLQGRDGVYDAIVEPKRKTVLIGAFVLEHLDFLIDPKYERLVPRDPRYKISEIE